MASQQPVAVVVDVDPAAASDGMQCSDHPYRRSNPGGICAFCLQEKLGKLVSSSITSTPFFSASAASLPSSSSSSSPSPRPSSSSSSFPKTTLKPPPPPPHHPLASSGGAPGSSVLKRSKSVAPRPMGGGGISEGPTTATGTATATDSPRKKSFWSFLYLSSGTSTTSTSSSSNKRIVDSNSKGQTKKNNSNNISYDQEPAVVESPASSSSFGRKVARSRSVGCGSRSFSGDFLERISTGFGDCTLRRVESHREPNNNNNNNKMVVMDETTTATATRIKERVKCGGIFGGFGMISTSASSSYWLAAAAGAAAEDFDGGSSRIGSSSGKRGGRSRSWAWAFASPMRAFRPASASSASYGANSNAISSIKAANNLSRINATANINNAKINNANVNGKVGGNANLSLLAVGS